VIEITDPIKGMAFFPGGSGTWHPKDGVKHDLPIGGIMILGHDFHSEEGFMRSRTNGRESEKDPTWLHLLALLRKAEIPVEQCFFTNFYMGLRKGKATTGEFPGKKDAAFVQRCQQFFLQQLEVQRPRAVLMLGKHVPPLLAPLSPQLDAWKGVKRLMDIDERNAAWVEDVMFPPYQQPVTVIALTHPSLRNANVGRRRFGGFSGGDAEMAMLERVVRETAEPLTAS
jgi:uracil-DNA glycosylase